MTTAPAALDLPGPSRRIVVEPLVLPEPDREPERPAVSPPPGRDSPAPPAREPDEEPVPAGTG